MNWFAKRLPTFVFLLGIGGSLLVFGQAPASEKWVEINEGDGLFVFSVPEDFLVDKDGGLDLRIIAFAGGVTFEIQADKFSGAKTTFKNLKARDHESLIEREFPSSSNKTKAASVKKFASSDSPSHRIFLNSGDRYYRIFIRSDVANEQEASRFLESIVINGKPLDEGKTRKAPAAESKVAKDLRTSQEIADARAKKQPKRDETYSYFPIDAYKPTPTTPDPEIRRAIIVDQKPPILLAFAPGQHKVKARVELLANGLVGKVTIYANIPEKMIPHIIETALGIKFIPAKKGSNYVDSVQVVDYSMNIGTPLIRPSAAPTFPGAPRIND